MYNYSQGSGISICPFVLLAAQATSDRLKTYPSTHRRSEGTNSILDHSKRLRPGLVIAMATALRVEIRTKLIDPAGATSWSPSSQRRVELFDSCHMPRLLHQSIPFGQGVRCVRVCAILYGDNACVFASAKLTPRASDKAPLHKSVAFCLFPTTNGPGSWTFSPSTQLEGADLAWCRRISGHIAVLLLGDSP